MRAFILSCLFVSLLLVPATALAQKPKPKDFGISSKKALNYYFDGLQLAQYRDRGGAMQAFSEAIAIEPNFGHAHYHLGLNAYVLRAYEEALPHLEKAYEQIPDEFAMLPFFLGETYLKQGDYEKSIAPLTDFVQKGVGKKADLQRAAIDLRHARFAAKAILEPVEFEPENLGETINSERDEYLPYLTADDSYLLFTSRRPESVGGYQAELRDYSEDFFYSEKKDGEWQPVKNLGPPINTPENEGAASISQDGRLIFFTACNQPGGVGNCDLYLSTRTGDEWSVPQNLGPVVNSETWDSQPCLAPDGKTLYFASVRKGGEGGRDIWFSRYVDGRWTEAQPLGPPVNSPGNEDSPFLHADGRTLYFSSDFHPGFGAQDLFVSHQQLDGSWSEPQNLGYPLNTAADESNIFVNASGRKGYINSDREGGFGRSDLYSFELDEAIRPQLATFLRGTVADSLSDEPVYARIRLIDAEQGDTIREVFSDRVNGRFLMSLPLDRQYAAFVEAPGYLFYSKSFFLKDLPEATYFDLSLKLKPIRKDEQVVLENIFFEFGSFELLETSEPELEFLTYFLKQNPRLRIEIQGHTDDVGAEADNEALSQQRAESVRSYLVGQGIDGDRIEAKGYGESQPIADNETEAGRALNRRTEFKILETGE